MKKVLTLVLLLCLTAGAACADSDLSGMRVASGNVKAAAWEDLTAPFSGTLLPFDLEPGDAVSADQVLFSLRTTVVRAPENGKITAVFAAPGSDAAAVINHYGALVTLEAEHPDRISAKITGGGNKKENKVVRPGETLYFRSDKAGREEGEGTVISVSGEQFLVEITSGSFERQEILNLYRDSDYGNNDKVGSGPVIGRDPVSVTGYGRIASVSAEPGALVREGDPLLTLLAPDADPDASADISPAAGGIVLSVAVQPGQQVWKGQLLARVARTDALEVVAEVDEMDLGGLAVGTVCPIVADMMPDTRFNGTVTEISGQGYTRQNAAYFLVHLSLPASLLPLGASCSVYLPQSN